MSDEGRHVLVVDDSALERDAVAAFLTAEGYDVAVAADGAAMRQVLDSKEINLVIVDLRMPDEDGFSLVRYLRQNHVCGIIMLTSARDLDTRVMGLDLGADDYISKPYQPKELIARVNSVIRRLSVSGKVETKNNAVYLFDDFAFDMRGRKLARLNGENVHLTGAEYALLSEFITLHGSVLSRDHLMQRVHGRPWNYADRSIDILVARLRKKLEADGADHPVITSVRGSGYFFHPDIERQLPNNKKIQI